MSDRREYHRRYHLENKEYERWRQIKKKYGLTKEAWETLFDGQGSRCAMCGNDDPNHKHGWMVDHDHASGNIRGILCDPCNRTLGHSREDTLRLLAGVAYLERHRAL